MAPEAAGPYISLIESPAHLLLYIAPWSIIGLRHAFDETDLGDKIEGIIR